MNKIHALRTVDVWDTLLRRRVHPDFSKLASARQLVLAGFSGLAEEYRDCWRVYRERCAIEGELVATGARDGEYELLEVLRRLLQRVCADKERIPEGLAGQLAEYELAFELQHTYADPQIRALLEKYPARKTLFLSDFYMPASWLRTLLVRHGLDDLLDGGLSSADVGANKRSGKLFEHVHSMLGISPAEHLHVGDHEHADVAVPQRLGIQAVHYLPEEEHALRLSRARFFSDRQGLFEELDRQARLAAEGDRKNLTGKARAAFSLGLQAAPLFIGFVLHVAEVALQQRLERIWFFTREGEFFLRIWQQLFPDNTLAGLSLPVARTLAVSRLASFAASLQDVSTTEMMRVWNLYSTQSMAALMKTLGLRPQDCDAMAQRYGLPVQEKITYPWQDGRVQKLFADSGFQALIREKILSDRAALSAYLNEQGWHEGPGRTGIVDIGWRGTIQDNLALLRPASEVHGQYLGLQKVLNPQPENVRKSAYGPDLNLGRDGQALLDDVSLLEMLCNAPTGSVMAYERNEEGKMIPQRLVDEAENAVHDEFTRYFQQAVLSVAASWAGALQSHVVSSADLRPAALSVWQALVQQADRNLAETYLQLNHNEVFGVGGFVSKREVPAPGDLFLGIFSRRIRQDVILFLRQTQWVSVIRSRRDLGFAHRQLLVAVMLLARGYKRLRNFWR